MVRYRKAEFNDRDELLDLIARGFAVDSQGRVDLREGEDHRILFTYLYALPDWDPNRVFVAEEAGRLLAAVGFFPQVLSFANRDIPVWAISPVVTAPNQRGRGLAGHCLNFGMAEVRKRGITAVFLWGIPDFYPKFGFVPLLPRYRTRLTLKPGQQFSHGAQATEPGSLRPIVPGDASRIRDLYSAGNSHYWLQPVRTADWWRDRLAELDIESGVLREVPYPERRQFLVWEKPGGIVEGYLYFKEEVERARIVITEAVAASYATAAAMLRQFVAEFVAETDLASQITNVVILGTPQHFLNSAAYRMGGTHLDPAPRFGMVKVLDWELFLAALQPLFQERLQRAAPDLAQEAIIRLKLDGTVLKVEKDGAGHSGLRFASKPPESPEALQLLTRLVFGFYDPSDLSQIELADELRQRLFPFQYPFIWDANYLY